MTVSTEPVPRAPARRRRWWLRLFYPLYLLLVAELLTRLAYAIPPLARRLSSSDAASWRRSWVERHRATGTAAYYSYDRYDATKGWHTQSQLRDQRVFGRHTLNTNARGLRGTVDYAETKPAGVTRVLVLGDSFTFGEGVGDQQTYPYLLQRACPGTEVINAAVHGYGHDQMLIQLEELGPLYRPDIVLVGFVAVDMDRNQLPFRDYAKPYFERIDGQWVRQGLPVPTPADVLQQARFRPRLADLYSLAEYRWRRATGAHQRASEEVTTALLAEIARVSQRLSARLVFAYLPFGYELTAGPAPTPNEAYFLAHCPTQANVRCLTTRPSFTALAAQGYAFETEGHWGADGHQIVAETLRRYLQDIGWAPAAKPVEH